MNISGSGSTASAISTYVNQTASNGDSTTAQASGSATNKLTDGTTAPQTSSTSSGQQSDLVKLRTYASEDMPVAQIAQRLGKTVSDVMLEAQAAGINLTTGNSSQPASVNTAIGNNVDTTA